MSFGQNEVKTEGLLQVAAFRTQEMEKFFKKFTVSPNSGNTVAAMKKGVNQTLFRTKQYVQIDQDKIEDYFTQQPPNFETGKLLRKPTEVEKLTQRDLGRTEGLTQLRSPSIKTPIKEELE